MTVNCEIKLKSQNDLKWEMEIILKKFIRFNEK